MITDTDFLEELRRLSPETYAVFEHHNDMENIQMLRQRIAVGICGMALPILDYFFTVVCCGWGWRVPSISATYYSPAASVFILVMGASCFFLCSYRGYDFYDLLLSKTAGIAGFVLSLFPCAHNGLEWNFLSLPTKITNVIHLASAGVFFLCLFVMVTFRFTKTSSPMITHGKWKRNILYRTCGIVMIVSIAAGFMFPVFFPLLSGVTYLGEAVALISFGTAWLVKGVTLFGG